MDIQTPATSLKYFTTCSELPIWNFTKYVEDNNGHWLLKDWNGIDEVDVSDCEVWEDIINEYYEILDDYDAQETFRLQGEISALEFKMHMCAKLVDAILMGQMTKEVRQEHFKELSAWGFAFNQSKLESELKRFNVWLLSIQTKVGFIKSDLQKYTKGKKIKVSLERAQVSLESATGRNNIDLKKTSVAKWLHIIKNAEETAKVKAKQAANVK